MLTHGGGAHVGAYLAALAEADRCDGVILADPDGRWEADARRVLKDKLEHVVRDNDEALSKHEPQMALVTMEAKLAPPVIDAALEANCHVFAEKPSCVRAANFEPLVQKADSKHRYLMLALANRTNPETLVARDIIASKKIGRLFGVEMHIIADQTRLTRESYHSQWFADKTRAGGGHLIWLGIHWLDLAMYVTGESITEVAGFTTNIGRQPINVEDSATAALKFESGALGTMTSGYYLDKSYNSHIKIWGSDGWVLLEPMKDQPLTWYTTKGDKAGQVQVGTQGREPRGYTPFVSEAIRACADMTDPPITSDDSLRALKTVFSIYSAAEDRRVAKVQEG
ncbi:MAG: Gfo/Idh/MocA family oxidoreductase [Planctomycetaceae bacterium]|nr:Gfo/Idh/MocA family oxidoreductase [Planctomycetales bacterium]MCB9925465.1 Gfo/Idh/MocA family oxidoreductase [Planctomycetaceae bacterium]